MTLERRIEALERRTRERTRTETVTAAACPAAYPGRWLDTLDVLAPHLDTEEAKAAAECATLLRDAMATDAVGPQVAYWCGIKLGSLAWHVHHPNDPYRDPDYRPVAVSDVTALRQRFDIDRLHRSAAVQAVGGRDE